MGLGRNRVPEEVNGLIITGRYESEKDGASC